MQHGNSNTYHMFHRSGVEIKLVFFRLDIVALCVLQYWLKMLPTTLYVGIVSDKVFRRYDQ